MINVVSWAASYGGLDHRNLVEAGFADKDVTACADRDGCGVVAGFRSIG